MPHHSKSPDSTDFSSKNFADVCDLCGLALRAGKHEATYTDHTYQFCCQGCRQVFSILIEATDASDPAIFRESDLFKQCQEMGIIPRSEADLASTNTNGKSNVSPPGKVEKLEPVGRVATLTDGVLGLNLKVSNMWCPACAWLIDESLKKTPGVIESACNFSTDRLQVNYNPIKTSPDQIIDAIKKLGYRAAE
ncbi:MAG: cation transporter, partial [Desulfobacterales bacterium]